MTKNNIKTDDLCERCEYGQCSGQTEACVVDRLCPLYSVFGCRCEQIRQNTPCPFFRDQEEDRETGKMSKMKKVPETGKNAMKPECEVCRITRDICTPAFLKEDPREAAAAMYYGIDIEIDPIKRQVKYCPACGKKLYP